MTRRWYYSILLIVASSTCVASLTRDTTLFIPGAVKRHARTSTSTTSIFSSKDPSNLSTEDLRKIAQKKGFDTNGMDRYGLERIVAEFEKSAVKSRPRLNASSKMNGQTPQESGDYMALPQSIFTDQPNGSASNQSSNGSIIQSGFINGYTFTSDEADEVDEYDQSRYEGDIEQQYKRPTKKTKKFWFTKDSFKAGLVGMLVGPVAVSPITYLHNYVFPGDVVTDQLSQFEFDTLAGGFAAAGFAVLYRHFIKDDKDETLANGCVGASVIARSFSKIQVMYYCENLICGEPFTIMDWKMLQQLALSMTESLSLFGAVALVLESFCDKGFISRVKVESD